MENKTIDFVSWFPGVINGIIIGLIIGPPLTKLSAKPIVDDRSDVQIFLGDQNTGEDYGELGFDFLLRRTTSNLGNGLGGGWGEEYPWCYVEVYVDGVLVNYYYCDAIVNCRRAFDFDQDDDVDLNDFANYQLIFTGPGI